MGESLDDLDRVSGSFDLAGLKKKYRRQDAASKPRNTLAAIEREILEEIASQSGRYGDRLDVLLRDMATLRQTIEPAIAQWQQAGMSDADVASVIKSNPKHSSFVKKMTDDDVAAVATYVKGLAAAK